VTDDPQVGERAAPKAAPEPPKPPRAEEPTSPGVIVNKHHSLATPAVRRLIREIGVTITDVVGTGKDGRVLKEDVTKFVAKGAFTEPRISTSSPAEASQLPTPPGQEETVALTPVQQQMFKIMTQSLAIPHFLYADEVVLDPLMRIKSSLNKTLAQNSPDTRVRKLTFMPFFIKALSLALEEYPLLNSHLDLSQPKPRLTRRPQHNIGVAMDTPAGLLVPSIKNVRGLSILDVASELQRLQQAGAAGKLTPADLTGGTITMSNIGNIGGTVTAPVIVPTELAIVGIGRARTVPSFGDAGEVVPKTIVNFSWSADHRVVDGATMARMAALLREYIQEPEMLLVRLK
jgi:2-oxoisovalerate dehydrogenase E2 component (dihydrolipoyl transacylase)